MEDKNLRYSENAVFAAIIECGIDKDMSEDETKKKMIDCVPEKLEEMGNNGRSK